MGTNIMFALGLMLAAAGMGGLLIEVIIVVAILAVAFLALQHFGLPPGAFRIVQILLIVIAVVWGIKILLAMRGGDPSF